VAGIAYTAPTESTREVCYRHMDDGLPQRERIVVRRPYFDVEFEGLLITVDHRNLFYCDEERGLQLVHYQRDLVYMNRWGDVVRIDEREVISRKPVATGLKCCRKERHLLADQYEFCGLPQDHIGDCVFTPLVAK
jgi:hypothetical protein